MQRMMRPAAAQGYPVKKMCGCDNGFAAPKLARTAIGIGVQLAGPPAQHQTRCPANLPGPAHAQPLHDTAQLSTVRIRLNLWSIRQ